MTKEQIYKQQMIELGTYDPAFDPEIRTLARIEREYTRAQKAWSQTAPPGGKPSFLDDHFPVIQKLRAEMLQHREALGLTPKALRKLTGVNMTDTPVQQDLITAKLDQIAERVTMYGGTVTDPYPGGGSDGDLTLQEYAKKYGCADVFDQPPAAEDPYAGIPGTESAVEISDLMDAELRKAVAEDMG